MMLNSIVDRPSTSALTTVPNNTTVLRGNTLSLICSTEANPDAHVYQFYFYDTIIGDSSSGVLNVTVEEDGVYTCVPFNIIGTGDNASVSVTAVGRLHIIEMKMSKVCFMPLLRTLECQYLL